MTDKAAAKIWLRRETRLGHRLRWPVVASGLAGTALAIGQAFCVALVLARTLTSAGGTGPARPATATLLIVFGTLALGRAALSVVAERAAFAAGVTARRRIRTDALSRLLQASPAALRGTHSAALAAVVVDRVDALDGFFARWLPAAILAVAAPTLVALAALWADPMAGLVLAVAGLIVPAGMALSGMLQASADELRRRTMRVLRVAFLSSATLDLAAAAALVLLALRYGLALVGGTLAAPGLALFALLLVPEFFAPLRAFAAAYQDRFQAVGAAEALAGLPEIPAPGPPLTVRTVAASGLTVAFEGVRLTWDQARGPALDGLSFRVTPGETLILAGPSGAGKSSAIEILLGFVRPDSGRVTINGADIADLVPQALARLTAWIGQRPLLFAGTIRDNIRFGRPEATDAEIANAARAAHVDEFAIQLPLGLDTVVGEGGHGLSGGQAQRVAIARAFLKNAPLLLLDEPTAHLDPATEAEVLDSLRRLALGRTVILASHSAAAHLFGGRRLDMREGRAAPARGAA